MGLLGTRTQEAYYQQSQSVWSTEPNGEAVAFTLTSAYFPTLTDLTKSDIRVFVNDKEIDTGNYGYNASSKVLTFTGRTDNETELADGTGGTTQYAPIDGYTLLVKETAATERHGNYQYIGIKDIINNFLISYVGENKLIPKVSRTDTAFHAQRGLAELSYDVLRSEKSQEIEIPSSLTMILPHDYVNYVKLTWVDGAGIERIIYPHRNTSNPTSLLQDDNGNYLFDDGDSTLLEGNPSETWAKYKSNSGNKTVNQNRAEDDTDVDWTDYAGRRYGLEPEYAHDNGFFFIDPVKGKIFFSSNMNGRIVTLKYTSDTLGTDGEMQVHKFAEEALYKYMIYAILSSRINIPEYIIRRYKQEKFAAIRNAKIRLSNIKLEELSQIMRNKSKWIK
jgi:hypothetical protein